MVDRIAAWTTDQSRDGSGSSPSSSESLLKEVLSQAVAGGGGDASGGRMMPSARRYARKGAERGISRVFGVRCRYLEFGLEDHSNMIKFPYLGYQECIEQFKM